MNRISYLLLRFMILLVRIMPFPVMYAFSDAIYILMYYVVRYRKKVVIANLGSSFPDKDAEAIRKLSKEFFHHLCDIGLESIKGFTMKPQTIVKRHRILNPELAEYYFEQHKSVIAVPAHYNNWEWGSLSPGLQLKYPLVGFYKPMTNQLVDNFARSHRAKFNMNLSSIANTARTFVQFDGIPHAYLMVADQSPTNLKDCYWFPFLNHDTAWLHGPEKYARRYNMPVIYVEINKVKRGYYTMQLIPLTEQPTSLPEGEITRLYAHQLEKSIANQPAFWLWSHRRWKHSR